MSFANDEGEKSNEQAGYDERWGNVSSLQFYALCVVIILSHQMDNDQATNTVIIIILLMIAHRIGLHIKYWNK